MAERVPNIESPKIIGTHAESEGDADALVLSPEELDVTISRTLAGAGCSLEQLRSEARSGEFSSEANWRLWFRILPFVDGAS